jgi:hypothetical protein
MTREQYEKLQVYEQELRYAYRMNFMSMSNGKFADLLVIYKDLYGETLTKGQRGCSTCRLNVLKKIAADYFDMQEQIAKEEKKQRIEATEAQPKKKAGRPKKIDLDAEQ